MACLASRNAHAHFGRAQSERIGEKCKKNEMFKLNLSPFFKFKVTQGHMPSCTADYPKVDLLNEIYPFSDGEQKCIMVDSEWGSRQMRQCCVHILIANLNYLLGADFIKFFVDKFKTH